MLLYNLQFCSVKAESDLNNSMICGGGADVEKNVLDSEWMRSQKSETPSTSDVHENKTSGSGAEAVSFLRRLRGPGKIRTWPLLFRCKEQTLYQHFTKETSLHSTNTMLCAGTGVPNLGYMDPQVYICRSEGVH